MPTILSFLSGRQITDDDGDPVAGAKLYHYEAGTLSDLTVYEDSAGDTPHAQPVVCDAGGFVPLIYIDDTSDWKVLVKTSADVTLKTYDELPAAESDTADAGFAPPLLAWSQVTSASSPVALAASDAGTAYEADTTSGNVEFDLPSAASVGNGRGFVFKKTVAANSMVIDPNSTQTIDDSATSLTVTRQYQVVGIFSNGAEWYKAFEYLEDIGSGRLASTFINSLTGATLVADSDEFLMQLASAGAFRKVAVTAMPGYNTLAAEQATTSGTAFNFTGIGANAKRVVVIFNEVSLSGSDNILVQIGDSGGVENTGYVSTGDIATVATNSTSGFIVTINNPARIFSGVMTLVRINSLTWIASYAGKISTSATSHGGGSKALSATLDRVTVTRTGTDTFDGGSISILWE